MSDPLVSQRTLGIVRWAQRTEKHTRFFAKVVEGEFPTEWTGSTPPTTPCHLWTASKDRKGYGRINIDGSCCPAHRVAYVLGGGTLHLTKEIDHLCRNPSCVNPEHLEQVYSQVNWWRGKSPSRLNVDKTHCAQGHELTPENVYLEEGYWRKCRTCRDQRNRETRYRYKASPPADITVQDILTGLETDSWTTLATRWGWTGNTLRKRVYPTIEERARNSGKTTPDGVLSATSLPKRTRTLIKRALSK